MDQNESVRIEIRDPEEADILEQTDSPGSDHPGASPRTPEPAGTTGADPVSDPPPATATADRLLHELAQANPHQAAFTDPPNRAAFGLGEPGSFSWAEADRLASAIARQLLAHGLEPGCIVALQMPNIRELPVLLAAIWRAGMVGVPLPMMWRLNEIHQAIAQIDPAAIVTVGPFAGHDHAATICEAAAHHLAIRHVFSILAPQRDGVTPIDTWFAVERAVAGPDEDEETAGATPPASATALMTWAEGPAGAYPVPRTHAELLAAGEAAKHELRLTGEDVVLNAYPFTTITGVGAQFMAALSAGASQLLHIPFDYGVFLSQLREGAVTYTAVPPAVIEAMEQRGDLVGASELTRIGCIWPSPHPSCDAYDFSGLALPVIDIYNLAELAFLMRGHTPGDQGRDLPLGKFHLPSAQNEGAAGGQPYLETRIRGCVTAENGAHRKLAGTLFVRGTSVPSGPFTSAGALSQSLLVPDAQGYLDTGISACVDESRAGVFRCSRNQALLYHGGAWVSAAELDRLYSEFPWFLDAAAFAISDRIMGDRIYAAVIPKPDTSPSLADLKRFLAEKGVAPYKMPDQLIIVSAIPRTSDGAVQREQILQQI